LAQRQTQFARNARSRVYHGQAPAAAIGGQVANAANPEFVAKSRTADCALFTSVGWFPRQRAWRRAASED
jgi:hypothetical protein